MQEIIVVTLQTVAVIVAIGTLSWRIQNRNAARNASSFKDIRDLLKDEVHAIEGQIESAEDSRRKEDQIIHERITNLESSTNKEINSRLSRIEGELKGLSNVTKIMEEWLIKNGGKVG